MKPKSVQVWGSESSSAVSYSHRPFIFARPAPRASLRKWWHPQARLRQMSKSLKYSGVTSQRTSKIIVTATPENFQKPVVSGDTFAGPNLDIKVLKQLSHILVSDLKVRMGLSPTYFWTSRSRIGSSRTCYRIRKYRICGSTPYSWTSRSRVRSFTTFKCTSIHV